MKSQRATDDGHQMKGKSSHCLWQGELKIKLKLLNIKSSLLKLNSHENEYRLLYMGNNHWLLYICVDSKDTLTKASGNHSIQNIVKDSCVYQFECLIISKYQFEVYTQSLDMQIVRLAEQLLYRDGQEELYNCDYHVTSLV